MLDLKSFESILAVGAATYAMRAGGYLAAGSLSQSGLAARFLRLAPGNLFVAFSTAGILQGGSPALLGCVAAVIAMVATGREWAALAAGFAVAATLTALI